MVFDAFAAFLPEGGSRKCAKYKAFAAFAAFAGPRAYARGKLCAPEDKNMPRARIDNRQMRQMRQINEKSKTCEQPYASNQRQMRQNISIHWHHLPDALAIHAWIGVWMLVCRLWAVRP